MPPRVTLIRDSYVKARSSPPPPPDPAPRQIRYVLSETAVRRLRMADRLLADLRERFYQQVPAIITCDISESYCALHEAGAFSTLHLSSSTIASPPTPDEEGD